MRLLLKLGKVSTKLIETDLKVSFLVQPTCQTSNEDVKAIFELYKLHTRARLPRVRVKYIAVSVQ